MLLSTQTLLLAEKLGEKEAIRIIKQAGFDAYDMSLFKMKSDDYYLNGNNYLSEAKALRKYADSLGIVCNQSHAPFPSSVGDKEKDKATFKKIVRAMEIAAVLGAKSIVVHPKQHLRYAEHPDELFNMNMEFYNRLIPYAEKFGIKIATENMWQRNNGAKSVTDSTCSRAWEFCKYIDTVNSKWLVGCLDIGHTSLVGADTAEFIRNMGNERLQALHVHDTDFISDLHTLPFTQKIDYIAVCKALKEINYKGDITFEADEFLRKFPVDFLPEASEFMCKVGRRIIKEIRG